MAKNYFSLNGNWNVMRRILMLEKKRSILTKVEKKELL